MIHLPTASWNVAKVKELFLPFEQERILSIPLSVRLLNDSICWDLEKGGDYSVRSAYRAIFGDYEAEIRTSGSSSSNFWGRMWAAATLPRVKVFFWRARRGALPTLVGLSKRIPGKNIVCSVCRVEDESELHCLRDCITARLLWDECDLGSAMTGCFQSFGELAAACFERLPREEHGLFMTVCWEIWGARNRWIFEGERCDPRRSMDYVTKLISELKGEEGKGGCVVGRARQRWIPPPAGWAKLNVDGGVCEGLGSSAGAVIRDEKGMALLAAAWSFEDLWEPRIAEAKALLLGVKAAVEAGFVRVVVESGCQGLINAMKSQEDGRSCFHMILDDTRHFCSLLGSVSWSFVRREGNRVAHVLAHSMPWEVGGRVWVADFPSTVCSTLTVYLSMNES
uniref:RNase H type-1 domain-containing protein n=1 Tax=Chenopodium quinoa TaxID=63459 RepID=A0A803MUC9_CHEQI